MASWLGGTRGGGSAGCWLLVLVLVVVGSLLDEQSDVSTVAQPKSEKCCSI